MAKTWILDTETKGTGAHVVPLEKVLKKPSREQDLALVEWERPLRRAESSAAEATEPQAPLSFKIVDIRSSQVLAEDVGVRAIVDLLADVGSVVDVRIYVWMPQADRWRLLGLDEQRTLWGFRGQASAAATS